MAIRSVHFAAQAEIEGMSFRPDVAVISITVPDADTAVLADFRYLLRLAFHDVEAGETPWVWFDRDHARLVVDFIDTVHALPDPFDLLVHCKAGYLPFGGYRVVGPCLS